MKRFQTLVVEACPDRTPWDRLPGDAISTIAARCEASDILEIIAEIETLEFEKASVPAWDGDAVDDITRAQALFARILAALPEAKRDVLLAALPEAGEAARRWFEIARSEKHETGAT